MSEERPKGREEKLAEIAAAPLEITTGQPERGKFEIKVSLPHGCFVEGVINYTRKDKMIEFVCANMQVPADLQKAGIAARLLRELLRKALQVEENIEIVTETAKSVGGLKTFAAVFGKDNLKFREKAWGENAGDKLAGDVIHASFDDIVASLEEAEKSRMRNDVDISAPIPENFKHSNNA